MKQAVYLGLLLFYIQTTQAQAIVKDIYIGGGNSNPCNFVRLGNLSCFIANDGLHGYELWVTDGTDAGTMLVKDIDPGIADGCMYHGRLGLKASTLQVLGKRVYFFATDEVHGFELWSSDGTELGTHLVKDIMPGRISSCVDVSLTKAGNYLFFAATDGPHGTELWRTDGTDTGTIMVKDIYLGPQSGNPIYIYADSDVVYFGAIDKVNGYGLWKSNGTDSGTVYLKDVTPNSDLADSIPYVKFKNELYFSGTKIDYGTELWKTNGTPDGTVMIKDINPGKADAMPLHFCVDSDRIVFSANTLANGRELWQSDGTAAGTVMFKDILAGKESSNPGQAVLLNSKIYFVADDSIQRPQLWVTDITDTGTHIFMANTNGNRHFKNLYADGGVIYFATDSADFGLELWRTDGTPCGTRMMNEICPGTCGSEPGHFFRNDTILFFSAYDDTHGDELWSIGANVSFIQEITACKLKDVYIDPLKRKLNQLRNTGSEVVYIKIFNLGGDELYTQQVKDPNQISSDSFKPGIYILRAYDKNDEMVSFVRFVKE